MALALDVQADLPRPLSHVRVLPADDPRLPRVGADPAVWGAEEKELWLLLVPSAPPGCLLQHECPVTPTSSTNAQFAKILTDQVPKRADKPLRDLREPS